MPIATPPAMRHATNAVKVNAQPVSTDDMANSTAARINNFLRPKRSLSAPERIEPARHPISAQLFAQPIVVSDVS